MFFGASGRGLGMHRRQGAGPERGLCFLTGLDSAGFNNCEAGSLSKCFWPISPDEVQAPWGPAQLLALTGSALRPPAGVQECFSFSFTVLFFSESQVC